jgi:hypothetical protein
MFRKHQQPYVFLEGDMDMEDSDDKYMTSNRDSESNSDGLEND